MDDQEVGQLRILVPQRGKPKAPNLQRVGLGHVESEQIVGNVWVGRPPAEMGPRRGNARHVISEQTGHYPTAFPSHYLEADHVMLQTLSVTICILKCKHIRHST